MILNTSIVINVTEGEAVTVNCTIGTNEPDWTRQDGGDVRTKNRQIRNGILFHIDKASVADTGVYICKYGQNQHTVTVQVLGRQTWVNLNCLTKLLL